MNNPPPSKAQFHLRNRTAVTENDGEFAALNNFAFSFLAADSAPRP
jgi:hypothetical protein